MARTNLSELCLTYEQMQMHGTELEKYLQRYLFPCVAIFGILGNALNLTVLLNRSMRSRANTFLALLAISDIAFLSLLVPNILANYPIFTFNYYFRFFYLNAKVHLLSFANWSSAVAIWSVIAVCADRLIGIRRPLYTRSDWRGYRMILLIGAMVVCTGALTLYQHVAYKCLVRSYCNGTQLYSKCLPVSSPKWFGKQPNPYSQSFRNFIDISTMLYVVLIIICPIVLLTVLNILLLCSLRKRTKKLIFGKDDASSRVAIDGMTYQKTEQRVTTVALIVTMFTVTNGPSALIHLLSTVYQIRLRDWYDITLIGSTLVICGKASNFILFCLCSKHFRNRLFSLTQKKMHSKLDTITVRLIDRRKDSHSVTHCRRFSVGSEARKERSKASTATPLQPRSAKPSVQM
ncbi:hypothetical protein L596_027700 [Steinernema carpocapsae]|uniref:G-protein coupled receptors family 1 profile domain-containing protein n=1 Tax=Steinernema carpocapsae TaxID=34508 RepID=A0A4V5ZXN9_STECR|nr:hypothetical protein L596_027700 [Steinernema carpocapsae]